jgi:hypothetical protein
VVLVGTHGNFIYLRFDAICVLLVTCMLHRFFLQAMSAIDDDATVTQLATAWVGVALGGGKVQEASYIYQELGDKFSWTVRTCYYVTFRVICKVAVSSIYRWAGAGGQLHLPGARRQVRLDGEDELLCYLCLLLSYASMSLLIRWTARCRRPATSTRS